MVQLLYFVYLSLHLVSLRKQFWAHHVILRGTYSNADLKLVTDFLCNSVWNLVIFFLFVSVFFVTLNNTHLSQIFPLFVGIWFYPLWDYGVWNVGWRLLGILSHFKILKFEAIIIYIFIGIEVFLLFSLYIVS